MRTSAKLGLPGSLYFSRRQGYSLVVALGGLAAVHRLFPAARPAPSPEVVHARA